MHRNLAGALLGALAVAVAACGESAPSPAQFRAEASAVCHDVGRRVRAIQEEATERTMQPSLMAAAAIMSDGLERLEAIEPPEQLADRYERFLAWKASQRDAALELAQPGGRLSARSARAVDAHTDPIGRLTAKLRLTGC